MLICADNFPTNASTMSPQFSDINVNNLFQAPSVKYGNDGKVDSSQCEPHGLEAHYFIESRLLQRDVEIVLESVNNKNLVRYVFWNGPIPASFCLFLILFQNANTNIAQILTINDNSIGGFGDSNPEWQDGRLRRIHWAMYGGDVACLNRSSVVRVI